MSKEHDKKDEKKDEGKRKFIESLHQYYSYKDKYESNLKKDKAQIIKLEGLSWREKRIEFMKIKPKCINCRRPVGSIFSTKVQEDGRHLIALCGDRKNPCPFNININLGLVQNIQDNLRNDETSLNDYKRDVIIDKNDLLFGYITAEEAVVKFDKLKDQVTEFTKVYEFTLQTYLNIVDNPVKKAESEKLQLEFYNNLDNFNTMIKQYNATQNTQLIVDAIDLYKNTMEPRANEIMNKKYVYNGVEYNEDDNTFHLIQKPITSENLEWDLMDNGQKVVSFKIGVEPEKRKPTKNVAFSQAIPDIRSKIMKDDEYENEDLTKPEKFKLKPQLNVQEDEDQEEQEDEEEQENEDDDEDEESKFSDSEEEESDDEPPRPKIRIHPNLLPDGTIAASEAHRMGLKIELVKGELIAKNEKTGETYKVTAGQG
jgi:hypothetical protein